MSVVVKELLVRLRADTAGVSKGLQGVKKKTDKVSDSIGKLKSQIAKFVGAAALTKILTDTAKAAGEEQRQFLAMEQALTSTAGAAGLTSGELTKLADGLQGVTTFQNDAIVGAESIMLTFTKVGKEVFPQALETVLDLSEAFGQDLKSSTIQLGKALNDPIRGVTALSDVGVSFSEDQRKVIRALQETGDMAGAQRVILEELNLEFGGRARKAAEGYTGKLKQMSNRFQDVQAVVGKTLLEALIPFVDKVVEFVEQHAGDIESALQLIVKAVEQLFDVLKTVAGVFGTVVEAAYNATPLLKAIVEGWQNILIAFTDQLSDVEDKQMGAITRQNDAIMLSVTKFREFRDEVGLTGDELAQMTKDFIDIEDPAARVNAKLRAIKQGKYDTNTRKLSEKWEEFRVRLNKTRQDSLPKAKAGLDNLTIAVKELKDELILTIPEGRGLDEMAFGLSEKLSNLISGASELNSNYIPSMRDQFDRASESADAFSNIQVEVTDTTFTLGDQIGLLRGEFEKVITPVINVARGLESLGILSGKTVDGLLNIANAVDNLAGGFEGLAISISSGDFLGAFSSAVGIFETLAGVIGKIFGKDKGELEAAERILNELPGVTEEWATEIENLAKKLGGADSAARAFSKLLPEIIKSTDITTGNFSEFVVKTREIISILERGNATAEETAENFGAAFAEMVKVADSLGKLGGTEMIGLVELADEFGLKIEEIEQFVANEMTGAVSGWRKVQEQFAGASIPELEEIIRLEDIIASIPSDIASELQGATDALTGLSNVRKLEVDEFAAFGLVVQDVTAKLKDQGIEGSDAIAAMKPLLERMAFLQKEFGFSVDDSTQAMIDQGIESGILKEDLRSDTEIMRDGFDEMNGSLRELVDLMRGKMPGAVKVMGDSFVGAARSMNGSITDLRNNIGGITVPTFNQGGRFSLDTFGDQGEGAGLGRSSTGEVNINITDGAGVTPKAVADALVVANKLNISNVNRLLGGT
jgi:hypothetical protein